VREVIHHIREGKHGARSAKQAIAIGLSKARRAGVDLPPPKKGQASEETRRKAKRDHARGQGAPARRRPSARRARAVVRALQREGTSAASSTALSRHAHAAARQRSAGERSAAASKAAETKVPAKRRAAARKAVRTKGHAGLARAARKAARTRKANA
jgi:hypothetical protein